MHVIKLEEPKADPYKRLAEAVLIQAIKDATHERRHKKQKLSRSAQQDKLILSQDKDKASHFLLNDEHVFPFWCDLAELQAKEVRRHLSLKLRLRSTYSIIRAHKDDSSSADTGR